jgi:hypothetical protein
VHVPHFLLLGVSQAVAAALLSAGTGRGAAQFVRQFGNDAHATMLEHALAAKSVGLANFQKSNGLDGLFKSTRQQFL